MKVLYTLAATMALAVAGAGFAACGGDDDENDNGNGGNTPAAGGGNGGTTLEISANNIEFDKDELTAPAGATVTLVFNNEEAVPHNVAFYESEDAQEEIFVGQTFTGPDTLTEEFEAPDEPGDYFFRCDVHPTEMTGDFVVE